jgi:type III secretory pathway component EscS
MSNLVWSSAFESVYFEFVRVLLLSSIYTLGPLAAASLVMAVLQALLQVQDAVAPQVVKLITLYLILYMWGNDLMNLWQGFVQLCAEVSLQELSDVG